MAVAAIGLGGAAAAAYASKQPASAQQSAHDTVGVRAAHESHHDGLARGKAGTPVGPNATGHAAYGLCTAYARASAHGNAAHGSVAFRNLVKAAGGADQVAGYCKAISHPAASSAHSSQRMGKRASHLAHRTGKPASHPAHRTGKPASHPAHP
jgi:hypothetical protein